MTVMHDWKQWESHVHHICGDFFTVPPVQTKLFIGDIEQVNFDNLAVAHIQTNASKVSRTKVNSGDGQHVFLLLQKQGTMVINQHQQQLVLKPGDMALLDSASCFDMLPQGVIAQMSVHLPREQLGHVLSTKTALFGKLSQTTLSGRMLRSLMQQMASHDAISWATPNDGNALQKALIALLEPALTIHEELSIPTRMMAEKLILSTLHDRQLSPKLLALQLKISLRQLYRLFDGDGGVARYITVMRLQKSVSDLMQTAEDKLSITDIAHKWGFYDSAHYAHVFKKYYGDSPKAYRQKSPKIEWI